MQTKVFSFFLSHHILNVKAPFSGNMQQCFQTDSAFNTMKLSHCNDIPLILLTLFIR